jgi:hypothetical protein
MKIIRVDNPEVTTITSSLLEDIEYNSTELSVNNIEDFVIGDILLLENVGYELCEIVYVTNITNKLIVTSTQYSHKYNTLITKINYDKYKIMRATSEVTDKSLIKEGNINYADVYNCIYYIDNTYDASDSLYYYVYYINSITDTETLASTLHNENNYGYISVSNLELKHHLQVARYLIVRLKKQYLMGLNILEICIEIKNLQVIRTQFSQLTQKWNLLTIQVIILLTSTI